MYEIMTDNLTLDDKNGKTGRRLTTTLTKTELTTEMQKYFGWTSTPDPWTRYNKIGSHDHDQFLQHLLMARPKETKIS